MLVEVHRVGLSFPDLLLSKGQYQVTAGPAVHPRRRRRRHGRRRRGGGTRFAAGDRVAGVLPYGGAAELVVVPEAFTFPLPDAASYDAGAAIPMNYLTAQFALVERGGLREGETVLVHGAAGGVGTATIQVARGLGARTIGSSPPRRRPRSPAGPVPTRSCCSTGSATPWTSSPTARGVDVVLDVVGGDVFLDSLRLLAPQGRLLVVGFASGQGIPEVKVNRLLLNNTDVRGVGWGAYAMVRPGYMAEQWERCCR